MQATTIALSKFVGAQLQSAVFEDSQVAGSNFDHSVAANMVLKHAMFFTSTASGATWAGTIEGQATFERMHSLPQLHVQSDGQLNLSDLIDLSPIHLTAQLDSLVLNAMQNTHLTLQGQLGRLEIIMGVGLELGATGQMAPDPETPRLALDASGLVADQVHIKGTEVRRLEGLKTALLVVEGSDLRRAAFVGSKFQQARFVDNYFGGKNIDAGAIEQFYRSSQASEQVVAAKLDRMKLLLKPGTIFADVQVDQVVFENNRGDINHSQKLSAQQVTVRNSPIPGLINLESFDGIGVIFTGDYIRIHDWRHVSIGGTQLLHAQLSGTV
ncbi:MAG: hypothetical protein ACR2PW_04405, partial [Gammaproteobacteria bacterium]